MDRLCGGTFFTLLCSAKRQGAGKAAEFLGEATRPGEPGLLEGLLRLMNPSYRVIGDSTMKTKTSFFKACKPGSTMSIPLSDSTYRKTYHCKVKTTYSAAVSEMCEFVHAFLKEYDHDALLWMTRAILRLLQNDETISDEITFYSLPDGARIGKLELLDLKEISLPILLTGVWDYITYFVQDNSVGRETIQRWIGEKEIANTVGEIPEDVGAPIGNLESVTVDYQLPDTGLVPEKRNKMQESKTEEVRAEEAKDEDAGDEIRKDWRQQQAEGAQSMPGPAGYAGGWAAGPANPYAGGNWRMPTMGMGAGNPFMSLPTGMPQQYGTINYSYNSGMVFNAPIGNMVVTGGNANMGTNIFELQSLGTEYYNLIVLDEEDLTTNVFCMPKRSIFTELGTSKEDRARFIRMGEAEMRQLMSYPAVIAIRNPERKRAGEHQMAILGKITEIRIQPDNVRLKWKMYSMFPQELLNQNVRDFLIYFCTLSNELDKEHWAVKPRRLLDTLRMKGVDPFQRESGMTQYGASIFPQGQSYAV